jgi:hypothetical protein
MIVATSSASDSVVRTLAAWRQKSTLSHSGIIKRGNPTKLAAAKLASGGERLLILKLDAMAYRRPLALTGETSTRSTRRPSILTTSNR